jgi:hypothetical protein
MRPAERGAVLLEAVVALTILMAAGVPVVSLLGASLASEAGLARREAEQRDLDRRLGRHAAGELVVEVQRPEPTLYRLAVSRPGTEALVTVVYRPPSSQP